MSKEGTDRKAFPSPAREQVFCKSQGWWAENDSGVQVG